MKQKRKTKQKRENVLRRLKAEVETCLRIEGLKPDKVKPELNGRVEVYFTSNNPQTAYAGEVLSSMRWRGYVTIDGLFNQVWGVPRPDFTAWIYVNRERLYPPSRWQRFKGWLGLL